MKLYFHKKTAAKVKTRAKKKVRIRKKVEGSAERPRLVVFRSSKHIYAQIVDDMAGKTLVEASTLSVEEAAKKGANKTTAKTVGLELAKRAKSKKISTVVFDRSGYRFHGKVQALAEGAREGGLNF